jgi:hypothetical protein
MFVTWMDGCTHVGMDNYKNGWWMSRHMDGGEGMMDEKMYVLWVGE